MKANRLTDADLAERAASYRAHKAAAAAEQELADADKDAVIGEMAARKLRVLVVEGLRVTVSSSRRLVSLERAKELLGPRKIKAVIRQQIDKKAWNAAVESGAITEAQAASCLVEEPVTPHIYVNPVKAAADPQQQAA